ncbi:hypothetical protein F2Q65_17005 [Thiohalocapsa marina]|uniref:Uncharacterized protein n=1 Tax=Thiohalocapsa marina TaxID=424902 RepID=A0A5M8FG61_9GAMM|nr:hypothetical protein [Thiohalocapsa marina]KAA6182910.1 hypothetical protein F2Q65_17005 [Thiohalocapsa marina]
MRSRPAHDPFAALIPPAAADLPIAWDRVRVPGLPAGFDLTPPERNAPTPMARFHRRIIHRLLDGVGGTDGNGPGDRLVLVDKALPHAQFDLMLSEASDHDKPSPVDVAPVTAQALWRSGLEFVRFVSAPAQQQTFGLEQGQLHLALNCDPGTRDRESVQAAKQFHLHLLYWTEAELAALRRPGRLSDVHDGRLRRQLLDPLAFLGARLVAARVAELDLVAVGGRLLAPTDGNTAPGAHGLGCVIGLPGWAVLGSPAFEGLVRRLHRCLEGLSADLLEAFTGERTPPRPWHRHRLLPVPQIDARVRSLGLPRAVCDGLGVLARGLRDLEPAQLDRLRRGSAAARQHCMTLNQPCYALNLHAPGRNGPLASLIDAPEVWLGIQTKLFSGVGGAGLLALDGVPSVRVLRGCGRFSEAQWRLRADFQRAFAQHNRDALASWLAGMPGAPPAPVRQLADFTRGWV